MSAATTFEAWTARSSRSDVSTVGRRDKGKAISALSEALRKAVDAGEAAAARLLVVEAIDDDAVAFYERFGFVSAPEHPRRLYRRLKDIRSSLERG